MAALAVPILLDQESAESPGASNDVSDVLFQMIERKDRSVFESLGGTAGIATSLHSDIKEGLASALVASNRTAFGANHLPDTEKVTYLMLVREALGDLMMRMLIVAAIISIVFGMTLKNPHTGEVDRSTGWIEGTAILVSVTLVVNVTAVNDYRKAKKFEEMSAEHSKHDVEVLRDGARVCVDATDLVAGDVLFVQAGQSVPADGVLIDGQDLRADESALTGESDVMKKRMDVDPFFISGTSVLEGVGQMLIVNVGEKSFAGRLAMSTRGAPADTPLQVKLGWLAEMIGKFGFAAATLTFAVLATKDIVMICTGATTFSITTYLNFLLVAVALVVVAIPEGLPLAVTIALAYSMKQMMADHCLVRVLAACETMGGANAICSDKTGTLTQNAMTVVQGWVAGDNFVLDGHGVKGGLNAAVTPAGVIQAQLNTPTEYVQQLAEAIALNSSCEEIQVDGRPVWVGGNKTEHGLVDFVRRLGQDYKGLRTALAPGDRHTYPFSSDRKRMTTLVRRGGKWAVIVTGASEMVLSDCSHVLTRTAGAMKMDPNLKSGLLQTIEHMADQGNRTIAVAVATIADGGTAFPDEPPVVSCALLAVLGLQDPIRPEVPEAVLSCQRAGITVRMVTGDNRHTATAIAHKCNLLGGGAPIEGEVMEGMEFRRLAAQNPTALRQRIPALRVLARSSPTDKLILVAYLMDQGDIVAVTGDGTNDAPALKLADVGFAMRSGTEVATGAADMVLMDDNFATVVRAAVWGRTVNENIRKFLQFQLSVNVSGVLLTLVGSAISPTNEEPLRPVQLLWLNLIMDTLAALALATELPSPDVLSKSGPIVRSAPLISRRMWLFIGVHAGWQLGMVLFLLYLAPAIFSIGPCSPDDFTGWVDAHGRCFGGDVHHTIVFNVYIWLQLFNEFNARKLYSEWNVFEGMGRSKLFFAILLLCIAFQICAVQFFGKFMATVPLSAAQWGICIALAATELPIGALARLIPVREWHASTPEDLKKGLDDGKKRIVLEAIAKAGKVTVPHSPPEPESSASSTSMISRRRRDSSLLAFRSPHPGGVNGRGIRPL